MTEKEYANKGKAKSGPLISGSFFFCNWHGDANTEYLLPDCPRIV